jgi:hypothetical protein
MEHWSMITDRVQEMSCEKNLPPLKLSWPQIPYTVRLVVRRVDSPNYDMTHRRRLRVASGATAPGPALQA